MLLQKGQRLSVSVILRISRKFPHFWPKKCGACHHPRASHYTNGYCVSLCRGGKLQCECVDFKETA